MGSPIAIKILILGDCGVGKSALMQRFCDDAFTASYVSTIGLDFKFRYVRKQGKMVRLQLWDTAGQERFRTITSSYYRGAQGIVIVYDSTDQKSFKNVKYWLDEIDKHVGRDKVVLMLLASKSDLTEQQLVATAQGHKFANEIGIHLFQEVSSKTSAGVELAFDTLVDECLKRQPECHNKSEPVNPTRNNMCCFSG